MPLKKFQISKIADGARNREYVGVVEWLANAGIVNICYAMEQASLPLKGNYNPDNYRLYFADTGLLIGSLDEEVQDDLILSEFVALSFAFTSIGIKEFVSLTIKSISSFLLSSL